MDQHRFEAALRALAQGTTRRRGLAATLGALLGGVGLETVAKRRATDADPERSMGRGAGPGAEGPCGNGSAKENRCKKNADCCTGMCRKQPGKVGRCRCLERGAACTANRNCCGDLACRQGVCSRSAPTPTPTPAPLVWTAQTPLGNGEGTDNDQFNNPIGVAVTADGLALYVADYYNHRIAVWTRATTSAAWQAQPPLGNGRGRASNQFDIPWGVAVTGDGRTLYVADLENSRIAVWTRGTRNDPWQAQTPLGNGDGQAIDQFNYPSGVAVTADELALYVADTSNRRIAVWTRATTSAAWQAQSPLGNGDGTAIDQFNLPYGVAVTADGLALYVADNFNQRIAVWQQV
jgi:DNA-binding beta-propeller fold protein YncE